MVADFLIWADGVMEASSDAFMLLLSINGVLCTLLIGVIAFVFKSHVGHDDERHARRREEMNALQSEHNATVKLIHAKLEQHDNNTTEFRVEVAGRMTRLETQLEALSKA